MKKFLLTIPFLFLAAACSKQAAQVQAPKNPLVQTPPVVQQATSTDETLNWNTCLNTLYGYELKYPSDWKFWQGGEVLTLTSYQKCTGDIWLSTKGDPAFIINRVTNADQATVQKYFAGTSDKKPLKETNLDGERALWYHDGSSPEKFAELYVSHKGKIYSISYDSINAQSDLDLFNKILSTFKFTK
jgi:hypothetical protein